MTKNSNLFKVFQGTVMDSNSVNKVLIENGISTEINNQLPDNRNSIFISEDSNYEIQIFANSIDYTNACGLIKHYFEK